MKTLWYFESELSHARERLLPSGEMQLLINLDRDRLSSFDGPRFGRKRSVCGAALSGVASGPRMIETALQRRVAGVHFVAGGAFPFFAPSALSCRDDLVELVDLWGDEGRVARERLLEAGSPGTTLDLLEAMLLRAQRSAPSGGPIERAVAALDSGARVKDVIARSTFDKARFLREFEARVGLKPKRFARIRRFQRLLSARNAIDDATWSRLAVDLGYHDQAHLIRDFRAFAGLTPSAYRPRSTKEPNHLPLAP